MAQADVDGGWRGPGCGGYVAQSPGALPPGVGATGAQGQSGLLVSHSQALLGWCAHLHTHTNVCKLELGVSFRNKI